MPDFPDIIRVQQSFDRTRIEGVDATVRQELARLDLPGCINHGDTVAVTAGSRGITDIDQILLSTVDYLRSIGAEPFLVPAMGSHGGGTAEGQLDVLESLGITTASMGCPIRASMDTVVLGKSPDGITIHFDRHASEADHVLVCGRVKVHTMFDGPYQSGLMKMLLTGLGKCTGATTYHQAFDEFSFDHVVETV
ncbi:MAG: DUF362 domain-containing protein, partial [Planctomycetales bacterium]